jgi:hypothetical protein
VVGTSKTVADKLEKSIEDGLDNQGLKVAPRKRVAEMLASSGFLEGCSFGPCLLEVRKTTGAQLVLVARITSVGPSYDLVISLLETEHGRVTSQVAERCEVCTLDEAISAATLAVIQVVTGAAGAQIDPALGPTGERTGPEPQELLAIRETELSTGRRRVRRGGVFFLGAAVVAAAAGTYFLVTDRRDLGYGALGATGAFALASGTLLVISRF